MIKFFILSIMFLLEVAVHSMNNAHELQTTDWAEKTLQSLTLEQKIGQMFVVATASNFEQPNEILAASMQSCPYDMSEKTVLSLIKDYYIGGVVPLYKSDPIRQMKLIKKFQEHSSIPLLVLQDCEWGLAMRLDCDPSLVVRYPRAMTLAAIQDKKIIYDVGFEVGQQCKAIGVHGNLAPVCDVNNNPENPVIADRSFGDDPEHVAECSVQFAQGLQDAGVHSCAKHFIGHGDTNIDSHNELPVIMHSKNRLEKLELIPFKRLIAGGVSAVMIAHLFVPNYDDRPNRPSSLSYAIVTEELKNRLEFKGLAITDGLGMKAITNHFAPGEIELEAYHAGNDIILCPLDVGCALERIRNTLTTAEHLQDLDQRVLKILRAKQWAMETQNKSTLEEIMAFLVRPEAYELQEKAFTKALTCVKNDLKESFGEKLLQHSAVITFGLTAENSFIDLLKDTCVQHSVYQSSLQEDEVEECVAAVEGINTIIIGIGQITKFCHEQFGINASLLNVIERFKKQGKQIIITIFGTPYCLPYFKNADALIIAYEDYAPAHKAAANFILGKIEAEGKLPVQISVT